MLEAQLVFSLVFTVGITPLCGIRVSMPSGNRDTGAPTGGGPGKARKLSLNYLWIGATMGEGRAQDPSRDLTAPSEAPQAMRQELPLSDAEIAALDDGVSALQSLSSRLENVPTPSGTTPRQLRDESFMQIEGT